MRKERRADRMGARAFYDACRSGDVEDFLNSVDILNNSTVDGWRLAMKRVATLPPVNDDIRAAFLHIWIEMKTLPLSVGDRRTLADALKVLMAPVDAAGPMVLYRGAGGLERQRRVYGFSWTSRMEIASNFAEHRAKSADGGVILRTTAPAEAILLIRQDENYYDEGEVVVDPFALGKVEVVTRLSAPKAPA
jgi:hypothetical protein